MSKFERKELNEERREVRLLEEIRDLLYQFLFPLPKSFKIQQENTMSAGTITGTPVGTTSTFTATPVPANAVDPVGAVRLWSTSDTVNTALTPSADLTAVSVAAAASAPVGGNYILTYTDTSASGTLIATSGPITVPFLAGTGTSGNPPTDFVINQTS